MTEAPTHNHRNGHGDAVQVLMDFIQRRGLAAGDRMPPIRELTDRLKLSANVVRDAMLKAQAMGLVEVRPRSGTFVRSADFGPLVKLFSSTLPHTLNHGDRNLFDLLEARRLIEVELAGMAAVRRRLGDLVPLREALQAMYANPEDYESYMAQNEAFHLGVAKIAGNEVLFAVLQSLLVLLRPTLWGHQPSTWKDKGSAKRERDTKEHEAIFEALLAGDTSALRTAMIAHLQDTTESLLPRRIESGNGHHVKRNGVKSKN